MARKHRWTATIETLVLDSTIRIRYTDVKCFAQHKSNRDVGHTRRRIDGGNNRPSTGSRGSTLRTRKYGKDAKNASVIVVHFAHCRVKAHKENEYVTPGNKNAYLASPTIAY
jgi:hypothetical protein